MRASSSRFRQVAVLCVLSAACAADTTTRPPKAPPATPTRVTATALDSQVVGITWSDNSLNEAGFRVERSATADGPWAMAVTTDAGATSASDRGLASEQRYRYRVTADFGSDAASSLVQLYLLRDRPDEARAIALQELPRLTDAGDSASYLAAAASAAFFGGDARGGIRLLEDAERKSRFVGDRSAPYPVDALLANAHAIYGDKRGGRIGSSRSAR